MSIEKPSNHNNPNLPQSGSFVGNCHINSVIGEGAVGIVYKGFEVDIEMERAIKVLKPDADDFLRRKFETEAKVMARLDHKNIVKVHGAGIWNGVLPFIKMEFIDGKSLRKLLDAHESIHFLAALSIVSVIADALHYAYGLSFSIWGKNGEKLVHRDIKPENLLISHDGVLKVMDFGMAQVGDHDPHPGWGTPAYMSPEQLEKKLVDCRTDIYSMGVLLYEMVCGKRPFPDEIQPMFNTKVIGKYIAACEVNTSIPKQLSEIIDKCLQPDRENRFPTYENFRNEILDTFFKSLSDTPEEIIRKFANDPEGFSSLVEIKQDYSNKPNGVRNLVLWSSICAFLLTSAIIIYSRFSHTGTTITESNKSDIVTAAAKPLKESPIATLDTISIKNTTDSQPSPQSKHLRQTTTEFFKNGKTAQKVKDISRSINHTFLKNAIDAYQKKQFTTVVSLINGADFSTLSRSTLDSTIILLADSYYQLHSIQEVIDIAKKYQVNDSRFLTVVSLAYEILSDYTLASQYMDKAIIAPSLIWKEPAGSLLYNRAEYYKRRFKASPDDLNRTDMVEAYRIFIQENCTGNDPKCNEARKIVKDYNHK
jgi:serine/threonine protein kinase